MSDTAKATARAAAKSLLDKIEQAIENADTDHTVLAQALDALAKKIETKL